jgi:hypothetical protein
LAKNGGKKRLAMPEDLYEKALHGAYEFLVTRHCNSDLADCSAFKKLMHQRLLEIDLNALWLCYMDDYRQEQEKLASNGQVQAFILGVVAGQANWEDQCKLLHSMLKNGDDEPSLQRSNYRTALSKFEAKAAEFFHESCFHKMLAHIEVSWVNLCCQPAFLANEFKVSVNNFIGDENPIQSEPCFGYARDIKRAFLHWPEANYYKHHLQAKMDSSASSIRDEIQFLHIPLRWGRVKSISLSSLEHLASDFMRKRMWLADVTWSFMPSTIMQELKWIIIQYLLSAFNNPLLVLKN